MRNRTIRVQVPQMLSLESAVNLYYRRIELDNNDIRTLFGDLSSSTICKLKSLARAQAQEEGVEVFDNRRVNTRVAFRTWGLDIEDLEFRMRKLREMEG